MSHDHFVQLGHTGSGGAAVCLRRAEDQPDGRVPSGCRVLASSIRQARPRPCHWWGRWKPALDAAGIPPRRIYDMRHSFATWALDAGLSIFDLSRYMGTSVEMIDRTYGHLAQGAEESARAKLDAAHARRTSDMQASTSAD